VRGVAHRDDQRRPRPVDRYDQVLLGHVFGDELDDLRVDVEIFEVDCRHAVLLRKKVGELRLFDRAGLDQRGADAGAVLLLLLLRLAELLYRNQIFADKEFAKSSRHSRLASEESFGWGPLNQT